MLVYILFIILVLLLWRSVLRIPIGPEREKAEKRRLNIAAFILLLLTALRGPSVGTDTYNYLVVYIYRMPEYDFFELYKGFVSAPAFHYLSKACSLLHLPAPLYLGIVEFIYISAIIRLINKFSTDKLFSFLCFFLITGMYDFSVPALKQCCAMGLMLHAFMEIDNKKWIRCIALSILAYFFHKSSLIFLFSFLLYYLRDRKSFYYVVGLVAVFCTVMSSTVLNTFIQILDDERYAEYLNEGGYYSWVAFIYYFILILSSLLIGSNYQRQSFEEARIMCGFSIIAAAFQSLSSVIPSACRLAYYYLPFIIILLPNSFNYGKVQGHQFRTAVLIFILFFYFYTTRNGGNIVPYSFFWQDVKVQDVLF